MKLLKSEKKDANTAYLEIEVEQSVFEAAMERSYKANVKKINIPGFRKGHAPRKFIEKLYGEAIFYDDAINFVCPDAYDEAVKEAGLDTVDMPEIDIVTIGEGKDFVFSATVTTRPEVTLGEYKGITAEKMVDTVTKDEVDAELKTMQDNAARVETLESGKTKKGDTVKLNFEGFVDGVAFDGGKGEDFDLELGSGSFIPGFEDQLIGKKVGEDIDVTVTFPEDYHAEDLKGKEAVFKCSMSAISRKELPKLDDEFAKDVSEFDTLAELRDDVKAKLQEKKDKEADLKFEDAVIEAVTQNATVEIPACMIERQIDSQIQDMNYRMQSQGMTMELYLQYTNQTMESIREQLKGTAENAVRMGLVLNAVAKAENVSVTDEDLEAEYQKLADSYKMELDKVKELMAGNKESLENDLRLQKTVNFLVAQAKVKKATKRTTKKTAETAEAKED